MEDEVMMMRRLKAEGLCCSSILLEMGLKLRGESNDQLVRAVRALCNGMQSGLVCGALTGSVCMLALFDEKNKEMTKEMADWFINELCRQYGSAECRDITHCDPAEKAMICPELNKQVYFHAKGLLVEYGYIEAADLPNE